MEDYPRTLFEFERRFANEEACKAYLTQLRWPEGYRRRRSTHRGKLFYRLAQQATAVGPTPFGKLVAASDHY